MFKHSEKIYTRSRLALLIESLKGADLPGLTIYFPAGSSEQDARKELSALPSMNNIPPSVCSYISNSRNGAALFWGTEHKYLVLPPFPINEKLLLSGNDTGVLESMLGRDFNLALIAVRMGSYGIGYFHGETLVDSKVGTGLVHSRHKKGGSSQRRYERHRDKQVEYFFTRVCQHVREKLESRLKSIELLYFGGETHTVKLFIEYCDFLKPLLPRRADILLNIREPGQKALANSIHLVYSSRVFKFEEEEP